MGISRTNSSVIIHDSFYCLIVRKRFLGNAVKPLRVVTAFGIRVIPIASFCSLIRISVAICLCGNTTRRAAGISSIHIAAIGRSAIRTVHACIAAAGCIPIRIAVVLSAAVWGITLLVIPVLLIVPVLSMIKVLPGILTIRQAEFPVLYIAVGIYSGLPLFIKKTINIQIAVDLNALSFPSLFRLGTAISREIYSVVPSCVCCMTGSFVGLPEKIVNSAIVILLSAFWQ